jgi:hypothetical protein
MITDRNGNIGKPGQFAVPMCGGGFEWRNGGDWDGACTGECNQGRACPLRTPPDEQMQALERSDWLGIAGGSFGALAVVAAAILFVLWACGVFDVPGR